MSINHLELIQSTADAATRLAKAIVAASAVQWSRSLSAPGHSEGRAKGGVSDPTADTATDERRLAVRAAVVDGELTLERFVTEANEKAAALESALAAWAGPRA